LGCGREARNDVASQLVEDLINKIRKSMGDKQKTGKA